MQLILTLYSKNPKTKFCHAFINILSNIFNIDNNK